jgi:hypothetical protein
MGKRSNFKRKERDFYPTPFEATVPLIPHLTCKSFIEPCAGDYSLAAHLESRGMECFGAYDIEPNHPNVEKCDAFYLKASAHPIITNPPWDRKILHPMIEHFITINHTWLLFDADWMHTKQSSEYMEYCEKVVSVGRVKWIPDSKMTGKDNCAWYLFKNKPCVTTFYGR